MNKKEFEILYALKKYGMTDYKKAKYLQEIDNNTISSILNTFLKKEYINSNGITNKGIAALKPYKVDNAVIMAAGISSRFVPLSIEKPKGLYRVKGEILIERQIEQLLATNIKEIVIVLGYKKEEFYYLKEKYKGIITFIENAEYSTKNNSHTIYLAKSKLKNTYICSSDNYFSNNPFDEYVYESYYSAIYTNKPTNEWYMKKDEHNHISNIEIAGECGLIMQGHAYFNRDFSNKIIKILESDKKGYYDSYLWETILKNNIHLFPPMEVKEYDKNTIYEFDSLDELKKFDSKYINNSGSKIIRKICETINCIEEEISNYKPLEFNEDNCIFSFKAKNNNYIYNYNIKEKTTVVLEDTNKK